MLTSKLVPFSVMVDRCNACLSYIYTPGTLVYGSLQHRDLVRVFFMGAVEFATNGSGPAAADDQTVVDEWDREVRTMGEEKWRPDERFCLAAQN